MMTRRAPGSGSVTMRRDGSALLRWRQLGRPRSRTLRGVTEDEAHATMDAIMERLAETGTGAAPTLRRYAERLLDTWELDRRGDIAASRSRWRRHVSQAPFADELIASVRPRDVKRWLDRLSRSGMGQQHRRHCAYLLSAIFRAAVEEELVERNPVSAVRKPGLPTSRRQVVLTAAQVEALAAREDVGATIALLLVGLCLRPGELLGLRVEDDCGDHVMVRRSGRKTREALKDGSALRRVAVFGWGEVALERWRALRPRLKGRGWRARSSPWLVPVPPSWLRSTGPLGAVLPPGFHAHDCRGTGATHLLSGTYGPPWEIADVAALIGDSVETTARAYAHVVPGRLAELGSRVAVPTAAPVEVINERSEPAARAAELLSDLAGRAWCDSNARPLASEALTGRVSASTCEPKTHSCDTRTLAKRYARAVADGDAHRDMRGLDLAEAVLRLEIAMKKGTA